MLFAQASSSHIPHSVARSSTHSGTPSPYFYSRRKTLSVWVAAATCAAASMTASFIAFYWFCRMRKRFRHRLIMLLIFGDALKATWLFVYAVVSIARGTVFTESSFCQASGFLVQYGSVTSDYSVLAMATHSAIQVFRPSTSTRNDGLYPYRAFIYAGAFVFPAVMSSLAFINPHWGYMSQGAFCSLPLRPFWYRLALAWVPRYLIASIILGLAVAIYTHVGFKFRSFSNIEQGVKTSISTTTPIFSTRDMEEGNSSEAPEMATDRIESFPIHNVAGPRRASAVTSPMEATTSLPDSIERGGRSQYLPTAPRQGSVSRPRIRRCSEAQQPPTLTPNRAIKPVDQVTSQPDNPTYHYTSSDASPFSLYPISPAHNPMARQRQRIHKQLRLIFIYPLTYTLMWLIPFVTHCMNYQDKWATHPLYSLRLLSTICVTLMGTVDCLIFSLRERPWRYIPASDGSFFGSFFVWRRGGGGSLVPSSGNRRAADPIAADNGNSTAED